METFSNESENPCLVETRQGFSVLYRKHFLYSKYNPSQSVKKIIEQTEIKKNTLVLVFSPLLFYGFKELLEKLPDDSFIFAIETDSRLFDFSKEYYYPFSNNKNCCYCNVTSIYEFSKLLESSRIPPAGNFRHVLSIDFSAGVELNKIQYESFKQTADNFISTFWKNRMT